ncbi:MAG: translation initiation factor IF-2 [Planctomycetota bacterium]|nr:MAG: translation initiation factor IF-2 [Planctomycetota bacterium]
MRIFQLAKELDLDSKVLLKKCAEAGIKVKSSALASISEEERDAVVAFIEEEKRKEAEKAKPIPPKEMPAPVRPARERRLRDLSRRARSMAPRGRAARIKTTEESEVTAPAGRTVAPISPALRPPRRREAPEAEPSEPHQPLTEQPAEPAPTVAAEAVAEPQSAPQEAPAEPQQPAAAPSPTAPTTPAGEPLPRPLRREDYVPAAGATGGRIREVGARSGEGRGKKRPKGRPVGPVIAAPPTFEATVAPKTEPTEKVQKPDIALTADMLMEQSPLADHLRKKDERRRRERADIEAEIDDKEERGRRRHGSLGLVESREQRRERRRQAARKLLEEEIEGETEVRRTTRLRRRRLRGAEPAQLKTEAQLSGPITVRTLSEAIGRPAKTLLQLLFQRGQMLTVNSPLDEETAMDLAMELGVDLTVRREKDVEEEVRELLEQPDAPETLKPRPPIVTLLGHVDHGKTSLLDRIRSSDVAAGEAGGITQCIRAYQVEHSGQKITFVDTPGHAAFGEMRARGANVTDIVVLVVAADDGVMPQTVECISHAKAAGVPIIVALNKVDLPGVDINKVLSDLSTHGIVPAEWGGDVEVVRTSAVTGEGIEELLETILLTAELAELKANPDRPAQGVCLEAFQDPHLGPLALVVIRRGTLKIGDVILCGPAFGRVRAMFDDRNQPLETAPPSMPVRVSGLESVPAAGDHLLVLEDIDLARKIAEERQRRGRERLLAHRRRPKSLEEVLAAAREGKKQTLSVIIKADTQGSIEALRTELEKFQHPEIEVQILHEAVGGVNESDVYLASSSDAVILAFNVIADDRVAELAEQEGVQIRRYNIIYDVTRDIKRILEGMLEPERVEVPTGRALVLRTFNISRVGTVAGCRVLTGTISRSDRVHVIRDQTVLNDYPIASLRREKEDVREVREGMECGIRLEGFNDVKEGDLLEAYRVEFRQRTLEETAQQRD